jgi:hypothetical protein
MNLYNIKMSFENKIKDWVAVDNRIKRYQDAIRQEKRQKNELAGDILHYVETEKMTHAQIQISDGLLKFQNNKVTSPLTFKFLKQCLGECIESDEKVDHLINYIKEKRDVKYIRDIKRLYQ